MPRISPKNPAGFVYCIRALNAPDGPPYHTKIGSSSKSFDASSGRGFIARFWIEALGLGELEVFEQPHQNAYSLEKEVHSKLKKTLGCGRSTEVFNITFAEAVSLIKDLARKVS